MYGENMEGLTSKERKEVKGFKVGDNARVIRDGCGHGFDMDTIVTVETLDENGMVHHARAGKDTMSFMDYELEKLDR